MKSPINELDRRVLRALPGREKIKALLSKKGMNLTAFAEAHNEWVEKVSMCIRGERPYPEIREKIARELELDRSEIDHLIDGEKAATETRERVLAGEGVEEVAG